MTTTRLPKTADIVVIGAGIAGASDAFFLSQAGFDVLVIDQAEQPASLTTSKSAASFRGQWDVADYSALVLESIDFYGGFAENVGIPGWDIDMRRQGWLFLVGAPEGPQRCERFIEGNRRLGVNDSEVLVGHEVTDRFPFVSPTVTAATYRAADGWLSPNEVVTGFLKASGAQTMMRTEVLEIRTDAGRVTGIRTSAGDIATTRVVVSCGPFSGRVAATAGASLPVLPTRRQLAYVMDCGAVPSDAPMVVDADTHAYWRPEGSGALLSVTRAEEPGEPELRPVAEWDYAAEAIEANARLSPFWNDVAPSISSGQIRTIAGQYTCTPDGRPLIGAVSSVEGLFTHTGDNGWGVESAPAAGRRLAEAVVAADRGDHIQSTPYSPGRTITTSQRKLASNWP